MEMEVSDAAKKMMNDNNFVMKSYEFKAIKEDLRKPRIVRIGAVQHSIVLPTSEPIHKQRDAVFEKVGKLIDAAALEKVNVLCLQELWGE
jgi:beta-ureidopropionase